MPVLRARAQAVLRSEAETLRSLLVTTSGLGTGSRVMSPQPCVLGAVCVSGLRPGLQSKGLGQMSRQH
jgi:hypothetical protein